VHDSLARVWLRLICAALALAGAAGEGYVRVPSPVGVASAAATVTGTCSAADVRSEPALEAPSIAASDGEPWLFRSGSGPSRRLIPRTLHSPPAAVHYVDGTTWAAVQSPGTLRTGRGVAHALAMARTGARSAHGTSLPPPSFG
jgi:hypothetical protein